MAMVKATFYLPVRDNDGRSLAGEIKDAEQRLWESFHAFTRAGVVTGAYRMADGTRADDDKRYELVIDDDRLADLKAILQAFKTATTQEAIYLELLYSVDIDFV